MNYISYRVLLFKLYRQRNKVDKYYKKEYQEAKKTGDRDKVQEVGSLTSFELQEVDDEIQYLEQRYIIALARQMLLAVPPVIDEEKGGLWEQSNSTGKWLLTVEGLRQLRATVRAEKKERTDALSRWVTIIVGLIGAITGLIAVIMK